MTERIVAAIERRWSSGGIWECACLLYSFPDEEFGSLLVSRFHGFPERLVYRPRGLPRDATQEVVTLRANGFPGRAVRGESWLSFEELKKLARTFRDGFGRESEAGEGIVRLMTACTNGERGAQARLVFWEEPA